MLDWRTPVWVCSNRCVDTWKARKRGGKSSIGAAAAGGAAAGFAAAGAKLAGGAVKGIGAAGKGMGWIIKWCFIIGIPLGIIGLLGLTIRSCATTGGDGVVTKTTTYLAAEPAEKMTLIVSDLLLPPDLTEQVNAQIALGKEKAKEPKKYKVEDIPTTRKDILNAADEKYKEIVEETYALFGAVKPSETTVSSAKAAAGFKTSDWANTEKVLAMAKNAGATTVMTVTLSSVNYNYSSYGRNENRYTISVFDVRTGTETDGYVESYSRSLRDNIKGGRESWYTGGVDGTIDVDRLYRSALVKDNLFGSGTWNFTLAKQSKLSYPHKKYAASPYGTQKWKEFTVTDKKAKKINQSLISSISFGNGSAQVAFADGTTKNASFTLAEELPQEILLKVKAAVADSHSNIRTTNLAADAATSQMIKAKMLHFYDGCFGKLTLTTDDGDTIFKNAPVYQNQNGEFALLAGYSGGQKGKAQFLCFEQ